MATRLPSGKWRAQVLLGTDENGKRIVESFIADTKDEADYAALTFKLGKGKKVEKKDVTLRVAMRAYIESRRGILSPTTIRSYETIEKNFGDYLDTPLLQITKVNLQTALTQYMFKGRNGNGEKKRTPKSVRNAYGLINAALKQNNVEIGEISLPHKQEIEYATPFDKDLIKIFEVFKGTNIEIPVHLATICSLRRGEICGLRFSDVDYERKMIRIERSRGRIGSEDYVKEPKTKKSKRVVFATDYILELIRSTERESEDEYIFKYTPDVITKRFLAILKKNGLPECRFHDLRHSFVSVLSAHGIDPMYIQTIGGWSSDRVMRSVYLQVSQDSLREKSQQANNVFEALMQHDATEEKKKAQ
ncbi:MAG: site-specific integrase [Ruminococcaceae bacterium]|nr:site-specific integrase [Oscillospiraceae bacterium]